jgi:hypothetical protein
MSDCREVQDALNAYPYYGHGKQGFGMLCDALDGRYCSACGMPNSLAWVVRHVQNGGAFSLDTMKKMVTKWKTERWYNSRKDIPHVAAMMEYLELKALELKANEEENK